MVDLERMNKEWMKNGVALETMDKEWMKNGWATIIAHHHATHLIMPRRHLTVVEKQELRVVMDNALTFDKSYLHSCMDSLSTCRLWSAMILRSYERIKYEDIPDHGG